MVSLPADQIEAIKDQYEPLILRVLNSWRQAIEREGYATCEPGDMHDECYSWSFGIWDQVAGDPEKATDGDPLADCSITIAESKVYDGSDEGINVIMDLVEFGGRILGGFSPYNYSDRVWTADADEIDQRFKALEAIDPADIVSSLTRD